jgi:hypothetical protein
VRQLQTAAFALAGVVFVGVIGARAFNPDNGSVLRSAVLWRTFGIAAEVGMRYA